MHACMYAQICERTHMWCRAVWDAACEVAFGAACTLVCTLKFVNARTCGAELCGTLHVKVRWGLHAHMYVRSHL